MGEQRIFGEISSISALQIEISGYIIFQMPTQILVVTSPLACRLHVSRNHASFLLEGTQFSRHFHGEHLRPAYLRYKVHFLLFLFLVFDFSNCFDRWQKGSSSQYPTFVFNFRFFFLSCFVSIYGISQTNINVRNAVINKTLSIS